MEPANLIRYKKKISTIRTNTEVLNMIFSGKNSENYPQYSWLNYTTQDRNSAKVYFR